MFYRNLIMFIGLGLFTQTALADKVSYRAVWHQGKTASIYTAPLSLDNFRESGQDLAESGKVLIDVETAVINGSRAYAGLWTTGTGSTFFTGPQKAAAFRDEIKAKRAKGLRLVDFEIFRTAAGGRRYIGAWRNGSGKQRLTGPMEEAAFIARGEKLTVKGLRLIDVELERQNGKLLYHGLFRSGSGDNFITAPLRLKAFREMRDQQLAAGRELIDMERVAGGPRGRFVGVWSTGPGKSGISKARTFAEHFIFALSQFNDNKHAVDFEMRVVEQGGNQRLTRTNPGTPGSGGIDAAIADLPNLPAYVSFTNDMVLRLSWTHDSDNPFTLELPRSAMPQYLPQDENGVYVLPDTFCGLEITKANNIFWQVPGNPALQSPPLLQVDVKDEGSDLYLGGVHFAGPFGVCAGMQTPWNFPHPFTSNASDFTVQQNLSLVIEIEQGSELRFLPSGPPDAPHLSADDLFNDSSEEKLKVLLETFAELFEQGQAVSKYCEMVGQFWNAMCVTGSCPNVVEQLPDCSD